MFSPCALGAPRKFTRFHAQQYDVLMRFLDSRKRFFALSLPAGSGKTLLAWSFAAMTGMRTLILTSTRQLMVQYMTDFEHHRLVDIKGQQNYVCRAVAPGMPLQRYAYVRQSLMCDRAPCHHGVYCKLMNDGCDYYDAQRVAAEEPCVLSNYSYWLAQGKLLHAGIIDQEPIGGFELIVCDEADEAVKELNKALKVELLEDDLRRYVGASLLMDGAQPSDWAKWAQVALPGIAEMMTDLRREVSRVGLIGSTADALTRLRALREGLERVSSIDSDWIVTRHSERVRHSVVFEAVKPVRHCEELLYRGAQRVVLMSATFTVHDAQELGAVGVAA